MLVQDSMVLQHGLPTQALEEGTQAVLKEQQEERNKKKEAEVKKKSGM
jgi:hypothetical protein